MKTKTAAKHTPGPLFIRVSDFFKELGHVFVVETGDGFTGKAFPKGGRAVAYCHREEDARLIAAAPDLLASLRTILREYCLVVCVENEECFDGKHSNDCHAADYGIVDTARAAIAKADPK